jgi:hypothetical protein
MGRIRGMQGSPRSLDQRRNSERKLTQHLTQTPSCEALNLSKHRSVINAFVHIIAAITAYQINPFKLNPCHPSVLKEGC